MSRCWCVGCVDWCCPGVAHSAIVQSHMLLLAAFDKLTQTFGTCVAEQQEMLQKFAESSTEVSEALGTGVGKCKVALHVKCFKDYHLQKPSTKF